MIGTNTECCQLASCPLMGLVFPQRRTRLKRNSAHISPVTVRICTQADNFSPKISSPVTSSSRVDRPNAEILDVWLRSGLPRFQAGRRNSDEIRRMAQGQAGSNDTGTHLKNS